MIWGRTWWTYCYKVFLSCGSIVWLLLYALNSVCVFHIQLKRTPHNKKNKNKSRIKSTGLTESRHVICLHCLETVVNIYWYQNFEGKFRGKCIFSFAEIWTGKATKLKTARPKLSCLELMIHKNSLSLKIHIM